jgi:hypothetical protein
MLNSILKWFGVKLVRARGYNESERIPRHCECGEPVKMKVSGTGRNWHFICPEHGLTAVRRRFF